MHLPRGRVAAGPCEVVVPANGLAASAHLLAAHNHLGSRGIQIFEQVGLLPLVVAHVKSVSCRIHGVLPQ